MKMRLFLVLCVVLVGRMAAGIRVPALMWTNDKSVDYPQVLAGHTVSASDFKQIYIDPLLNSKQGNIVIFVQDRLSIADISHYANVYGYDAKEDAFSNVRALMSDMTSTHLPNVVSPESALTQLDTAVLGAPYDVASVRLAQGTVNVIVVRLPSTQTEDYLKSLSINDQIIGSVCKQLAALNQPFYAIYTAVQPTKAPDMHDVRSPKRSLLATDDTQDNGTVVFSVSDTLLFYASSIQMTMNTDDAKETKIFDSRLFQLNNESHCDNSSGASGNNSCMLSFHYTGEQPISSFSLSFSFTQTGAGDPGYWIVDSLNMTYANGTDQSEPIPMALDTITDWTPLYFSYSCSVPEWVMPKKNGSQGALKNVPSIAFKNLQIQAFGVENGQFGHYNDCEGFFGLGVWMALICIAVMIAILVFGLIMLSDITTMDRYDDPKGKTIIVATGE